MKGSKGMVIELVDGFRALYLRPKNKIKETGAGVPQLLIGTGQGAFTFVAVPFTVPLRGLYNFSTGIKNHCLGKKDLGQRIRFPRYFDQNMLMLEYVST